MPYCGCISPACCAHVRRARLVGESSTLTRRAIYKVNRAPWLIAPPGADRALHNRQPCEKLTPGKWLRFRHSALVNISSVLPDESGSVAKLVEKVRRRQDPAS